MKTLIELVEEEAKALRKNTTKKERNNLNFKNFNPNSVSRCVYGQLAGDCDNKRAHKLLKQCAPLVYGRADTGRGIAGSISSETSKPIIRRRSQWWSPIEVYVAYNETRAESKLNSKLLSYLRGTRKKIR